MKTDIDLYLLQMNFLEFLTIYLNGRTTLPIVLEVNERMFKRDHATLSPILIKTTTQIHAIKERIDHGEVIDKDTIDYSINNIVLEFIKTLSNKKD